MATFRGLLEVEGDPESSVVTDIEVVHGVISMRAGGSEIGNWNLNDIAISTQEEFFRIEADDDVLLLRVRDAKRFAAAVGASAPESEMGGEPVASPADPVAGTTPTEPEIHASPESRTGEEHVAAAPNTEAAGSDETPLAKPLAWGFGGAAGLMLASAFLNWGPWHLSDGVLAIERLLIALAGLAALASAYLGIAGERCRDVAVVALLSGLIAIIVIGLYAREAGIGYGFFVAVMGAAAVVTIAVLALSHLGAPSEELEQ